MLPNPKPPPHAHKPYRSYSWAVVSSLRHSENDRLLSAVHPPPVHWYCDIYMASVDPGSWRGICMILHPGPTPPRSKLLRQLHPLCQKASSNLWHICGCRCGWETACQRPGNVLSTVVAQQYVFILTQLLYLTPLPLSTTLGSFAQIPAPAFNIAPRLNDENMAEGGQSNVPNIAPGAPSRSFLADFPMPSNQTVGSPSKGAWSGKWGDTTLCLVRPIHMTCGVIWPISCDWSRGEQCQLNASVNRWLLLSGQGESNDRRRVVDSLLINAIEAWYLYVTCRTETDTNVKAPLVMKFSP